MLDFNISIGLFNYDQGVVQNFLSLKDMKELGLRPIKVEGSISDILYRFNNHLNIFILDGNGVDEERLSMLVNFIYQNYCKNIIVVAKKNIKKMSGVVYLDSENNKNLDLKLINELMEMKKNVQFIPSDNIVEIKNSIHSVLEWFKFSPRYSGFRYFIDSILLVFLNHPKRINITEVYNVVGDKHGRSGFAVEKAMRTALSYAIKNIRNLPQTEDNEELRNYVKTELGNLSLINIVMDKLVNQNKVS